MLGLDDPPSSFCTEAECSKEEACDLNSAPVTKYIDGDIRFIPPLYCQRYEAVKRVILDSRWKTSIKKLCDLGCGELGFFNRLKEVLDVNHVVMVDIDRGLLDHNACRASPLTTDFLRPRGTPLTADVLCGSVVDHDARLIGADAVTCIEVIEHLEVDLVEKLVATVFGFIQPRIAVFTTPNSDFNVLFTNFSGFRHWDHKFEWTRAEFKEWVDGVLTCFPHYEVEISGVGIPPEGVGDGFGHCSQMAVFIRNKDFTPSITTDPQEIYTLIRSYDHPRPRVDTRTDEQKLSDEVFYQLHRLSKNPVYLSIYEDVSIIPLTDVYYAVREALPSADVDLVRDAAASRFKLREYHGIDSVQYRLYSSESESSYEGAADTEDPPSVYDDCVPLEYPNEAEPSVEEDWDAPFHSNEDDHHLPPSFHDGVSDSGPLLAAAQNLARSLEDNNGDRDPHERERMEQAMEENLANIIHERQRARHDAEFFLDDFEFDVDEESVESASDIVDVPALTQDCERNWNSPPFVRRDGDPASSRCSSALEFVSGGLVDARKGGEELEESVDCMSPEAILDCKRQPITDSGVDLSPLLNTSEDGLGELCCSLNSSAQREKKGRDFPKSTSVEVLHLDGWAQIKHPAGLEYVDCNAALCYTGQGHSKKHTVRPERKSLDGPFIRDAGDSCSIDNDRGDSGYPNSCSMHHDIDMDLTPEQVDDISSENGDRSNHSWASSEASDASDEAQHYQPLQPQYPMIPFMFDNVENGDLANNNRDGEGNNAVAVIEDEREFVALVQEGEVQPLLAAPVADDVSLPSNADPYPTWLVDLLKIGDPAVGRDVTFIDSASGTIETTASSESVAMLDVATKVNVHGEGSASHTVFYFGKESDDASREFS